MILSITSTAIRRLQKHRDQCHHRSEPHLMVGPGKARLCDHPSRRRPAVRNLRSGSHLSPWQLVQIPASARRAACFPFRVSGRASRRPGGHRSAPRVARKSADPGVGEWQQQVGCMPPLLPETSAFAHPQVRGISAQHPAPPAAVFRVRPAYPLRLPVAVRIWTPMPVLPGSMASTAGSTHASRKTSQQPATRVPGVPRWNSVRDGGWAPRQRQNFTASLINGVIRGGRPWNALNTAARMLSSRGATCTSTLNKAYVGPESLTGTRRCKYLGQSVSAVLPRNRARS